MTPVFGSKAWPRFGLLVLLAGLAPRPGMGGEPCCPPRAATPTARVVLAPRPRAPLGTFTSTPALFVRNGLTSGGFYSPLGFYGNDSMALYGPLSAFRQTSAPVLTYSRGYDGRAVVTPGTSFSSPNLPAMTPVIYPTQANAYYGPRRVSTPPWWQNASNWIDQN